MVNNITKQTQAGTSGSSSFSVSLAFHDTQPCGFYLLTRPWSGPSSLLSRAQSWSRALGTFCRTLEMAPQWVYLTLASLPSIPWCPGRVVFPVCHPCASIQTFHGSLLLTEQSANLSAWPAMPGISRSQPPFPFPFHCCQLRTHSNYPTLQSMNFHMNPVVPSAWNVFPPPPLLLLEKLPSLWIQLQRPSSVMPPYSTVTRSFTISAPMMMLHSLTTALIGPWVFMCISVPLTIWGGPQRLPGTRLGSPLYSQCLPFKLVSHLHQE